MSEQWYVRIPAALLSRTDRTATQKVVLAYLRFRQGNNGGSRRAEATMARDLGLTVRTIRRIARELVALGDISVSTGGGRRRTNTYAVNPDKLSSFTTVNPDKLSSFTTVNPDKLSKKPGQVVRQKGTRKRKEDIGRTPSAPKAREPKPFAPPTAKEVNAYAAELGYHNFSEPNKGAEFVAYYEERGWKDSNGRQVKNWKGKLRSVWLSRMKKPERGDFYWLPTEEAVDEIYAQCGESLQ
ncbi:MAG TPA: hypothetical protein P5068_17660 [Sedimentisphaerales bacterium]|nr:hypothetical protein [Sedimentisphaerales bacterium]HRV49597.1 hypothetical protein [Sedimentisphaerales bacterium]